IRLASGNFGLLTATDTQVTDIDTQKTDSGKIVGTWRAKPPWGYQYCWCRRLLVYIRAISGNSGNVPEG
ncbi:MAG: hypothetical protein WB919_00325, partial [Candidatus Sulfotelmatobacter sp.]